MLPTWALAGRAPKTAHVPAGSLQLQIATNPGAELRMIDEANLQRLPIHTHVNACKASPKHLHPLTLLPKSTHVSSYFPSRRML